MVCCWWWFGVVVSLNLLLRFGAGVGYVALALQQQQTEVGMQWTPSWLDWFCLLLFTCQIYIPMSVLCEGLQWRLDAATYGLPDSGLGESFYADVSTVWASKPWLCCSCLMFSGHHLHGAGEIG
ncbi:hypothetical protein Nepgr_005377 [Nepenthes gracilis]|uniref:Uncharacterized protein n=1 Tax=Nepenthes gracilis TaxID=150966 RepID=A0AAD3XGD5_NEPGR|nr:hypothetical protein Nepgr_005377 [Nepenthes gracilis]